MKENKNEEYISFSSVSHIILRRWKVIAAVFLVTFLISFPFISIRSFQKAKSEKPVFTAETKIMIGPVALEAVSKEGQVIRRFYSYGSEIAILESNIVAIQAAGILKDMGYKEPQKQLISEIRSSLEISSPGGKQGPSRGRGGNIVVISATLSSPQKAYDMVRAIADGYLKQKKQDENKFFKDTYETFTRQLEDAKTNLHVAENKLTDFVMTNEEIAEIAKNYGIGAPGRGGTLSEDVGISEKYLKIKSEISSLEDLMEGIRTIARSDAIAALSAIAKRNDTLADLNLRKILSEREEDLERLLLVNEDAHPAVIQARSELRSIQNKIKEEIESALNSLRADLDTLKAQDEGLAKLIESDVHKKIVAYNLLKRDIKVKSNIYNKLAEELQQVNLGEKLKRYSELRVLEPAQVPTKPSNPTSADLSQSVLLSLFISFACSIAAVYGLEMFDTSIKDVEQLEKLIDIPVLVSIPLHRKDHKEKRAHSTKGS
ncbi:MAG: hypothetical protein HQ558_01325 [Candidatus Omnitrophica bacterium]|nr:hypothetical protein [Candidatus Omnitrophota bacterium]